MFMPFTPGFAPFVMEGVAATEDYKLFIKHTQSAFEHEYAQARKSGMRTAVLSSELLQIYMTDFDRLTKLSDFLKAYFADIEILLTVRPQVDAVVSLSSTAARAGEIIDEAWFRNIERHKSAFSYHRCESFWSGMSSHGKFHIHKHDQTRPFSSILERLVGLDARDATMERQRNSALSVEALRMLNALQLSTALTVPMSVKLTSKTEDDFPFRSPLSIGLSLAQWIQSHFDKENEDLLERFRNLKRSDLFPDWTKYYPESNLDALSKPCDFSPELAALMASMAELLQEAEQQTSDLREAFQRSTSWRVTAPLRNVKRRARHPDYPRR